MGKIKEKKLQKKKNAVAKKQKRLQPNDDEDEQIQSRQKPIKDKHVDVFEIEDTENVNELRKYQDVDIFDYELPSDFEDEEISSESDEELPKKTSKSTKPSKSSNKKQKFSLRDEDLLNEDFENDEGNINIDEEDGEDDDEDEYQNLSELLDDEPVSKPAKSKKSGRSIQYQKDEGCQYSHPAYSTDEEEEEYSSQEDNEDELDEDTHNNMLKSILDNNKDKKKRKKKEIMESVPESEFNLKNTEQISMADLMGTLNNVTGLTDVKKQIEKLSKKKKLSEPLPKVVEDRLTRASASKQADEQFQKWRQFSKELKTAPQLQFPLKEEEHVQMTTAKMVEEFHPLSQMEKDIDQLLRATGVHKEQMEVVDELEHRIQTEDELKKKEVELAKLARMLFFQEQKNKRQKKIKSKEYHRRLKKEKEKNKLSLEELREVDPELAAQEEEKMQSKRIEERISLRHSRTKSAFSKHAHTHNEEARKAVQEQMEMRKQLLSKMQSMDNEDDDESQSDPEVDKAELEQEEAAVSEERKHSKLMNMKFMQKGFEREQVDPETVALNRTKYLPSQASVLSGPRPDVVREAVPEVSWTVDAPEQVPVPQSTAVSQPKKAAKSMTRLTPASLEKNTKPVEQQEQDDEPQQPAQPQKNAKADKNNNNKKGQAKKAQTQENNNKPSDNKAENTKQAKQAKEQIPDVEVKETVEAPTLNATPVPQLAQGKSKTVHQSSLPAVVPKDLLQPDQHATQPLSAEVLANGASETKGKKKKKNKKSSNNNQEQGQENKEEESNPWIAPENAAKKTSQDSKRLVNKSKEREQKKNEGAIQIKMDNAISLDNLDQKVKKADKFDLNANSSIEQQALISRAFTTEGVDYEAEFQAMKQQSVEAEMPQMESDELPGWGSWGGLGVSVSQKQLQEKKRQEKAKKFETVLKELQKRREDYQLGNVVIHEGMTKEQARYTVRTIPRNHTPITYEKTLTMPVGREWNTTSNWNESVKPRVEVKPGVAIQPVSSDTVKRHKEDLVKRENILKRQIETANAKPQTRDVKKPRASSKL